MFSCEFCDIFQNTFFYRTPPSDCFCIMHFRRCTFNLFNNPCLERKGNQGNCMFKQFVSCLSSVIYLTLILALILITTFSLLILFSSYFWKRFTDSWRSLVENINPHDSAPPQIPHLNINKIESTTPSQEFFWDISKYNFFFTSPNRIASRNNLWATFSVGGLCHFSSIPVKFYWFILCCTLSATFFLVL